MNYESPPRDNTLSGATEKFSTKKQMPLQVVAGISFSLIAVVFVLSSILLPNMFLPIQLMINEIGIILLPTLLILIIVKYNIKDVLRLNKPKMSEIFLSLAFPIILFPALSCLAAIVLMIVEMFFGSIDVSALAPLSETNIWILILCAALLPAICEEVLFRGIVLKGLQKNGAIFGIILSSILFGLFHMDFQRFIAQVILGVVAGIVVYRTNSIFCGMIVHFTNNTMAFAVSSLFSGEGNQGEISETSVLEMLRAQAESSQIDFSVLFLVMIILYLVITIFFIALSLPLFYALFKVTKEKVKGLDGVKQPIKPIYYLAFVPGLLVIIGVYGMTALYLWNLSN